MKKDENQNLNAGEKKEIKQDVQDAIGKALKKSSTNIDKTLINGTNKTLNQKEIDKIITNNPKKTSKTPIIITTILIIIIAIIGFCMYYTNNPKTMFTNAIHYYSDKILNKYIALQDEDNLNNLNKEEKEIIKDSLTQAISKGISSEKITSSKTQINEEEKITKTQKVSLIIDSNNVDKILTSITNNLKADKTFKTTLQQYENKNETQIESEINQVSQEIKKEVKNSKNITINIYKSLTTNEFVKYEVIKYIK